METILVQAVIGYTSNKQADDFTGDNPRKTFGLHIVDEDKQKALNFGLREYGKEVKYFPVKASKNVKVFKSQTSKEGMWLFAGDIEVNDEATENASSNEKVVTVSIIKGNEKGNDYFRVSAILDTEGVFTINEDFNPFG